MDNGKQQIPKWFIATGITASSLYLVGTIISPARVVNEWKIAAAIVGAAGIATLLVLVAIKKKEK
jgi:hypothetical protein